MSRCAHCGGDDHATPACPDPTPQCEVRSEWVSPIKTIADLLSCLLTLDQAMEVHGAYHISTGEDRCRARGLSLSRERVTNNRIYNGDGATPYSLVIWTAPEVDESAGVAQEAKEPPVGLAAAIAAKLKHPIFQGLRWETYDAYLPLKFVGPCSVTDWYAKTPSGKEIIVSAADKNDCISLHDAIVPEASSVPSAHQSTVED